MRSMIEQLRESGVGIGGNRYSVGFNAFRGPEVGRGMGTIKVLRRYDGSEQAKGDPAGLLRKMIKRMRKRKKRVRWGLP